jgi:hypothetical protein
MRNASLTDTVLAYSSDSTPVVVELTNRWRISISLMSPVTGAPIGVPNSTFGIVPFEYCNRRPSTNTVR